MPRRKPAHHREGPHEARTRFVDEVDDSFIIEKQHDAALIVGREPVLGMTLGEVVEKRLQRGSLGTLLPCRVPRW